MDIARFTAKRFLVPGVLLLILVLLATAPLYASSEVMPLIVTILMYSVLTVSWAMFSAPSGYISLASAAFFGIGAYSSALLFARGAVLLPWPAVIVIGGLVSFCAALIIGSATLRLRGIYFIMFTFGLLELARRLIQYFEFSVIGTRGRYVADVGGNTVVYYAILAIFVAMMLTAYFIRRSRYGLALQSIGENEEAAAHTGVNTTRVKILTFAISAIFMGAAGAVIAARWGYMDPTVVFNLNYSFLPVMMAIVGGMGQLYGPLIGAIGFTYLRDLLLVRAPGFWMIIFGIILVVFIVFLPGGLASLIERGRYRLRGVIAKLWKGGEAEKRAHA